MLTSTGIGSGLDIEGLVTQLLAAERSPVETRLAQREETFTARLSAFGAFKSALSSFQDKLPALNNTETFGRRSATSSDSDSVSIAAGAGAATGSYAVTVEQLAIAHSLASGSYASATEALGTGTLTIRFGATDYTPPVPGPENYAGFTVNPERGVAEIAIDESNNTLEGIRDAVNEANIGVSAVIVNDGGGYRLLFNSDTTGVDNSLEINVEDTGDGANLDAAGLSALAFNAGAQQLSQTVAARDAQFTINGLAITSGQNTATKVIDDVSITLREPTGATPVTLAISEDRASVKSAITGFVDAYNGFMGTVSKLTAYNAATGAAGALQGDFSARSISNQLRQVLTSAVDGFEGPFNSLSEIGITTRTNGALSIDSGKLDSALADHFKDIVGLFSAVGVSSDAGVEYAGAGDNTTVGNHAVNITQLATKGQFDGAAISFPLTVGASNDNFSVRVDGIDSGPLDLTPGSYASGAALAAELQSRINGANSLVESGATVAVNFNVDHFEITSSQFGAASRVEFTAVDTDTAADLGLSVGAGVAGKDVAGSIGGLPATGSGQLLTVPAGSASEGLRLVVTGGALGDRGAVTFSRGLAYQLNTAIGGFLADEGILDTRTDGIQQGIDRISDSREALNRRLESLEARYRSQFNALDSLLSQLQGTSNFLTQQLASLPKAGSLLNNN